MPVREFPADVHAPAAARRYAAGLLAELVDPVPPGLRDDVELIVSELVTNAVRAGSASAVLELERIGPRVAIRVSDSAGGWPEQRVSGIHDTTGRGLALVSALSSAWGVRLVGTGKLVWAELSIPTGS